MTIDTRDMQSRLRREVAMPSRLGHTALLSASAITGGCVLSLLLTEPALPARTQWAFMAVVLIAAAWMSYATWVLLRRRVLFGRQRIAAARLACLFTAVAFIGSTVLRAHVGFGAMATTGALALAAGAVLWRAHRHVRRLQALAHELGRVEGTR